ncbi:MAG: phosphoglycerate dehydrogenase, partial [Anaerolineae bacterium]|nr:phosphoglycerate dehydrogenase [Anaerolineae bacterium]
MSFHILVPDNLDKAGLDILKAADGFTVLAASKMSRDELLAAVPAADALIIRSASKVDSAVMDVAPRLKVVGRAGVGVDNIDLDAATARGIIVMNAPDGNTVATAELAMGLMLALARHIPQAEISIRAGQWEKKAFMGIELRNKTLGLIGFGRIGQAVARRAKAFDMTVIAYDPYCAQGAADALGVELVTLDDLFARADFISLHAASSAGTRNIINAQTIQKMK